MGILHRIYTSAAPDVWHTESRLLHALSLVRRPVAAQWLVTAACDLACPHCYSEAGRRARDELTTDEAKHLLIDALVDLGCPLLVLAGGELLLRRDIPELVEYACGRGLRWAMHTHGGHVSRFASLLRRHPPDLAAISLDGDRSFHDAFRGKAGSYDAAIEAARVLRDAGCPEVVLGTTVTRYNADRLVDLYPRVESSAAHSWGLHLFAPEGRGHRHTELFPTPAQLRRVAAFARRKRASFPVELCNEWGGAGEDDRHYRDQPFACGAGRISFVVSATGDVLPCTTTDPAEAEGNLRTLPLRQIWSERFVRFREGGQGDCGDRGECWLQTRNGVSCARAAFGDGAAARPLWVDQLPSRPLVGSSRDGGIRAPARLLPERATTAVRIAAAGLVFLQGCVKRTEPASSDSGGPPPPTPASGDAGPGGSQEVDVPGWDPAALRSTEALPAELGQRPRAHFAAALPRSRWQRVRAPLTRCASAPGNCEAARAALEGLEGWPGAEPHDVHGLRRVLEPHVQRVQRGELDSVAQLGALLDAAELVPVYDAAWAAYLWTRLRSVPVPSDDPGQSVARARLLGRLHRHLRVVDAFSLASQRVGPVQMRPWLKKSAPPRDFDRLEIPPGLVDEGRKTFEAATAGTFDTLELPMSVQRGRVDLARAGDVRSVAAGGRLRLRRLDVVRARTESRLHVADDVVLVLPAGEELTAFDAPARLDAATTQAIEADVAAALAGDEAALARVEARIVLSHQAIRQALQREPQAPGAAALRTVLVIFDE